MKKKCLILFLFIITIELFADNKKSLIIISGNISEKYEIEMILKTDGNSVNGYYYYTKYKTKIPLTGIIENRNSNITLIENPWIENSLDNPRKGFKFKIIDSKINGIWFDKNRDKEHSLLATLKFEKVKTSKLEGNYESKYSSDKYHGNVELNNINDNLFLFSISTATETGCIGEICGIITIENRTGKYTKNGCNEITITFEENILIINEKECHFHGYRCSFEDKYMKKKG